MTGSQPADGRRYSGQSTADRQADRRETLMDAGLALFGTVGLRETSVRAVCRKAGLSSRYFYESFSTVEDLLTAVYERCIAHLAAQVVAAVDDAASSSARDRAQAGLDAFTAVAEDRLLARVVWFEVLGVSTAIDRLYIGHIASFADLLIDWSTHLRHSSDRSGTRAVAIAAAGGISHSVLSWIASDYHTPRQELVHNLIRYLEAIDHPDT